MLKFILGALILIPLLAVGGLFYLGVKSQSGAAPGLIERRLAPCPASPNCVSSEADVPPDHAVEPLPAEIWDALPGVIEGQGGVIISSAEDYIAAEFKSKIFRFVDDVEFRKAEDAVHMRSASRVGKSDMGANAKRAAALAAAVNR